MAFINETVPEPDRGHPFFQHGLRWPHHGPKVTPGKWTIDRERDVFITVSSMGGVDQGSVYFIVGWRGELVRADFDVKLGARQPDGRCDLTWKLRGLILPDALEPERELIVDTLKEALDVHGYLYQRDSIRDVHFSF